MAAREIIALAESDAKTLTDAARESISSDIDRHQASVSAAERSLGLLQAQTAERLRAAERLEHSLAARLKDLESRAPVRPLGALSMQKLVERVMPNWNSQSGLAEIAFEVQMREGSRAAELLAQVSQRLSALGVRVPAHLASDNTETPLSAKLLSLQQQVDSYRATVRQWQDRYEVATERVEQLRLQNEQLLSTVATLRSRRAVEGVVHDYYVAANATREFLEYSRKYWRSRLHPDRVPEDTARLTKLFQAMDSAFDEAVRRARS